MSRVKCQNPTLRDLMINIIELLKNRKKGLLVGYAQRERV